MEEGKQTLEAATLKVRETEQELQQGTVGFDKLPVGGAEGNAPITTATTALPATSA